MPDLAVDVGQTGIRAMLTAAPDEPVRTLHAPGEHLTAPGAPDRLIERIAGVRAQFPRDAVDAVLVGTTGFEAGVARSMLTPLVERLGCRSGVIADDSVTAFLGALGPRSGVTLVAGTGVVALAAGTDGSWHRAGGWGWAIDDEGGGFWLGRAGLAVAARAVDREEPGSELLIAARHRFGPPDGWPASIYGSGAIASVASFAFDVITLGAAGDTEASALCRRAAVALARTARAATTAIRADRILAVTGALAPPHGLLDRYLDDALEQMAWRPERARRPGSPLDGAAMLGVADVRARFPQLVVTGPA
jgi:N-acetylglucosamine kinase-like BadF-type ATPase